MKNIINAKSFREAFHKRGKNMSNKIDEHYEVIWKLAQELQTVCDEPTRITTVFGDFTFVPKPLDYQFSII